MISHKWLCALTSHFGCSSYWLIVELEALYQHLRFESTTARDHDCLFDAIGVISLLSHRLCDHAYLELLLHLSFLRLHLIKTFILQHSIARCNKNNVEIGIICSLMCRA